MNFTSKRNAASAVSPEGYRIAWAENMHGTWFNCWSPAGKHFHSGYDREKAKGACVGHLAKSTEQP